MNYTKSSKSPKCLVYKTDNKKRKGYLIFSFQNVKTLRSFGRDIMNGNITLNDVGEEDMKLSIQLIILVVLPGKKIKQK